MNRYLIASPDYATPIKLYYTDVQTAKQHNPSATSIVQIDDLSHQEYIEKIIAMSSDTFTDYKGRQTHVIYANNAKIYVRFYKDTDDNTYYDYCEYQMHKASQSLLPVTFTMSSPKQLYDILPLPMKYSIISHRRYGEPKLAKPKELKGIAAKSIDFIPKKCKCKYYIKGNDLIIYHRDYFSPSYCKPEDIGTPLTYRLDKYNIAHKKSKMFIYDDNWADIVLRSEAYIKFDNFAKNVKTLDMSLVQEMCKLICKYHKFSDDLDYYWYTMFEQIIKNETRKEDKQ